ASVDWPQAWEDRRGLRARSEEMPTTWGPREAAAADRSLRSPGAHCESTARGAKRREPEARRRLRAPEAQHLRSSEGRLPILPEGQPTRPAEGQPRESRADPILVGIWVVAARRAPVPSPAQGARWLGSEDRSLRKTRWERVPAVAERAELR